MNTKALIDKVEALPPERMAEAEDFVDFIRMREETRALARPLMAASEPAFARTRNNPQKLGRAKRS